MGKVGFCVYFAFYFSLVTGNNKLLHYQPLENVLRRQKLVQALWRLWGLFAQHECWRSHGRKFNFTTVKRFLGWQNSIDGIVGRVRMSLLYAWLILTRAIGYCGDRDGNNTMTGTQQHHEPSRYLVKRAVCMRVFKSSWAQILTSEMPK